MEGRVTHVCQVLVRLLENKLFVKTEKFEFHFAYVTYFGYIIKSVSCMADPEKICAVHE